VRLGVRNLAVTAAVAATALMGPAVSQARDATVTSFDGTKIQAHFFPAQGLKPGQRAPTVMQGPGWSLPADQPNGNVGNSAGSAFGVPGIDALIAHGYNVLTWDPRGFGDSGGTVEIDDPRYEGRDAQALIDFVAQQPEAQLERRCRSTRKGGRKHRVCRFRAHDPRVGMSGGSYGGGIQLVTAAIDKRVDAIIPTIAWNSLLTAIFPERQIKNGWGSILIAAGVQGSARGGGQSPSMAAGRQDPHFYSVTTNGLATGNVSDDDYAWMDSHGPRQLLKGIHIPTLLVQGTVDTLFPLDEAVRNFQRISRNKLRTTKRKRKRPARSAKRKGKKRRGKPVPVKMIWFCGGHGACFTGNGPAGYLEGRQLAWFDRYLKGNKRVNTGARFSWIADDSQVRNSDAFPLKPAGSLHGTGSGTLPIVPGQQGSGGLIFASAAPTPVNVTIPGPSSDANVIGAPHLQLTYQGNAAPAKTWVEAQLVNPRNGLVLGNIATPIPVVLDGQQHSITRDLEMVAGRAPAGGGYTLQLAAASTLYDLQRSAGSVDFSSIDVTLPLGDPVTAKHKKKKRK
jgi:ABC-2 type transport system ATP-binding protein